ncbi:MAG: SDR family NAD(P)-dependent oxidoreductase [Gemmatimonadales bacterium]|nr:MAG: SDR family NAD(P)-dependent oxidoreductase [Gemmatimonadales bacterium]
MTGSAETWLVVGATSPVARAFALEASAAGSDVILAGRDEDDMVATASDIRIRTGARASVIRFEAEHPDAHPGFVEACLEHRRGILNVFFAVGTMPMQEDMDRDPSLARRTGSVNYLGPVSLLSLLAPVLEEQKAGAVVVLGSVAGDRGRLSNYVYGSSKAALHVYLQGLRARLFHAGVGVTTVKPGFIDTSMTWGEQLPLPAAPPRKLARACLDHAGKGTEVVYFPWFWRPIMTLLGVVPERVFKRFRF